jgi:hypothetical protein
MKKIKNIFISLMLMFGVLCYCGHGFVDYYGHLKSDIENTNSNSGSQNIVTSEHSLEEEATFISAKISVQIINSGSERLFATTFSSPLQLAYPIWLPPKVS